MKGSSLRISQVTFVYRDLCSIQTAAVAIVHRVENKLSRILLRASTGPIITAPLTYHHGLEPCYSAGPKASRLHTCTAFALVPPQRVTLLLHVVWTLRIRTRNILRIMAIYARSSARPGVHQNVFPYLVLDTPEVSRSHNAHRAWYNLPRRPERPWTCHLALESLWKIPSGFCYKTRNQKALDFLSLRAGKPWKMSDLAHSRGASAGGIWRGNQH
ncbi:hypothetical protein V8F06_001212 [Rhypophila decipiens]